MFIAKVSLLILKLNARTLDHGYIFADSTLRKIHCLCFRYHLQTWANLCLVIVASYFCRMRKGAAFITLRFLQLWVGAIRE
jgi:hypothetical protein